MFDAHVASKARQTPRAPAILTPAGPVGYAALDADVNRLAAGFADLGLAPDVGVVSVRIGDTYLRLASLLALARLGIASSPAADQRPDARLSDAADPSPGPPLIHLTRERLSAILGAEARPPPPRDPATSTPTPRPASCCRPAPRERPSASPSASAASTRCSAAP